MELVGPELYRNEIEFNLYKYYQNIYLSISYSMNILGI